MQKTVYITKYVIDESRVLQIGKLAMVFVIHVHINAFKNIEN